MLSCTLNEIRAASPCEDGWRKLLGHLGKAKADDTIVTLETVLDSNGLDDALWVLDNVIKNRRIISLFAADCAERVLPIFERDRPDDDRPRRAIVVARDPDATSEDLDAARDAALDAAVAAQAASRAAARAARAAVWGDARAAGAAGAAAGGARAAQKDRLRQYCEHAEDAANMPWPDMEESE